MLALPKRRRRPHPDGIYLEQINIIKRRMELANDLKKRNLNALMVTQICNPYSDLLVKTFRILNSDMGGLNFLLKKVGSSNWINWLNQQHIECDFQNDMEHNSIYIGFRRPQKKYKYNLIFNCNAIRSKFKIELCCCEILTCTNLNGFEIHLDNNLLFSNFIEHLKHTNNLLFLHFVTITKHLKICII